MFTGGESQAIFHVNGRERQTQECLIQQPAVNPRGRVDTEKSAGE